MTCWGALNKHPFGLPFREAEGFSEMLKVAFTESATPLKISRTFLVDCAQKILPQRP